MEVMEPQTIMMFSGAFDSCSNHELDVGPPFWKSSTCESVEEVKMQR